MRHEPRVSSIARARDLNEQRGSGQRLLELRVFEAISCQDFSCTSTPNFFAAVLNVLPRKLRPAVGVIYRPDTERQSLYCYTRQTSAVEPRDVGQVWSDGEAPEIHPSFIQPLRKCDENERH